MRDLASSFLGLGNGGTFAALGIALVLVYRASGVINFATGAQALYAGYTYAFLRQGKLFLIIPGLPTTTDLGHEFSMPEALVLTLVISALLGALLYGVVYRPLRYAPPLAKAVASLGVLVILQGLMSERMGTIPVSVEAIYPSKPWTWQGQTVLSDRVYLALTVIGITLVITVLYRWTRFGLDTRATAENEAGAYVSGISPDRIALLNWMLAGAVVGAAGILIAPLSPVVPSTYTLFVVPALAAAVVGKFQYLVPTAIAGIGIGMIQAWLIYLSGQHSWMPQSGVGEMVPLDRHARRAARHQPRGSGARRAVADTSGTGAATAFVSRADRRRFRRRGDRAARDQWLHPGRGHQHDHLRDPGALPRGGHRVRRPDLTGAARPRRRRRVHAELPLGRLGCAVPDRTPPRRRRRRDRRRPRRASPRCGCAASCSGSSPSRWRSASKRSGSATPTSSSPTATPIGKPEVFGINLGVGVGKDFPRLSFGFMCLIVCVVVAAGVALLRRSSLGSAMLAVRANERSAAGIGVNVVFVKVLSFAIASFVAGIGGCLLSYRQGIITWDSFAAFLGLTLVSTAYLAGVTSVYGGVQAGIIATGGIVFYLSAEWIDLSGDIFVVISGVLVIVTLIRNPEGLAAGGHELADKFAGVAPATRAVATTDASPTATDAGGDGEPWRGTAGRNGSHRARTGRPHRARRSSTSRCSTAAVVAVDDLSLRVPAGGIVGLIGPNGAGKTSAVDAITGFAKATGAVLLDGTRIDGLRSHQRVRRGLARTFQALELYDDLSVEENVSAAAYSVKGAAKHGAVQRSLDLVGITDLRDRNAGDLSQGQRQLVSIARACAADPKVLLLDEPAAGLDTTESRWLGDRIRNISVTGTGILLIDHDVALVLDVCDYIYVLDFGRVIAEGEPGDRSAPTGMSPRRTSGTPTRPHDATTATTTTTTTNS